MAAFQSTSLPNSSLSKTFPENRRRSSLSRRNTLPDAWKADLLQDSSSDDLRSPRNIGLKGILKKPTVTEDFRSCPTYESSSMHDLSCQGLENSGSACCGLHYTNSRSTKDALAHPRPHRQTRYQPVFNCNRRSVRFGRPLRRNSSPDPPATTIHDGSESKLELGSNLKFVRSSLHDNNPLENDRCSPLQISTFNACLKGGSSYFKYPYL